MILSESKLRSLGPMQSIEFSGRCTS